MPIIRWLLNADHALAPICRSVTRKDGTTFWANVTITTLRDEVGQLLGFAKLTRDLTQTKRAEAMETANQQREEMLDAERNARMTAQRATRLKDEFLATLSHELRTPLSAILGWTQLLLRPEASRGPEERKRAIEIIDRNARAQVKLIDDLLDLSRVMTGKLRLDLHQVSLASIVEAAVDSARPSADVRLGRDDIEDRVAHCASFQSDDRNDSSVASTRLVLMRRHHRIRIGLCGPDPLRSPNRNVCGMTLPHIHIHQEFII